MKRRYAILPLLILLSFLSSLAASAFASFTVTTDKSSYYLGETLVIFISGATPNGHVLFQLNGPNGPVWAWEETAGSDGSLTYELKLPTDWPTGEYTLYVKDAATGNTATYTFSVSSPPPVVSVVNLSANVTVVYVGGAVKFTAYVYDQYGDAMANVEVKLYINGEFYASENTTYAGEAEFIVTFGEEGIFEVYAIADDVKSNSIGVRVLSAPTAAFIELTASETEVEAGDVVQFTATVYDQYSHLMAGVEVNLIVDGALYDTKTTGTGGMAFFLVRFDAPGTHEVYAAVGTTTSNIITITVSPPPPTPTVTTIHLEVDKTEAFTGESVTFRATVYDQNGNPMPDVHVTFYVNDEAYSIRTTDTSGVATLRIMFGEEGAYTVYAVSGSVQSNSVTVTVTRPPPGIPTAIYVVVGLVILVVILLIFQILRRRGY